MRSIMIVGTPHHGCTPRKWIGGCGGELVLLVVVMMVVAVVMGRVWVLPRRRSWWDVHGSSRTSVHIWRQCEQFLASSVSKMNNSVQSLYSRIIYFTYASSGIWYLGTSVIGNHFELNFYFFFDFKDIIQMKSVWERLNSRAQPTN